MSVASQPLWSPTPDSIARTNLTRYLKWLAVEKKLGSFADYAALWEWSVADPGAFWTSIAEFYGVKFHTPARTALSPFEMPGAKWFEGATLNYAEHALRSGDHDNDPAIIFEAEGENGSRVQSTLARTELREHVARVAAAFREMGVARGDRVAGYLSNTPEAVIAFLATASLGAIWSNCPVEMTARSVLDRLEQIAPKVLVASTGYWYGAKRHDRREIVTEIAAGLPSLQNLVLISADKVTAKAHTHHWADLVSANKSAGLIFEAVPFEQPLWVLYSSGTTGKPKAIVHGHGGILLEHLKALSLHMDLGAGDRFFWFTTSGWMMWNLLVSGLLLPGCAIVLYDGSPKHPNFGALWELVARLGVTYFGSSAPYYMACRKEGVEPARDFDLSKLRGMGSTAAPLPIEGFRWIYDHVKKDVLLGSISGGTDVCSAFIMSNPHLPVEPGKLQCVALGAKVEAWNEKGESLVGEVGELVLAAPFPSMPVCLWNDPDGARLRASYFEKFPGTWCHGDWIELDAPSGPCVIHGRSDATLNRGGVRMGTVEFYAIIEALPEIADSLVIDTGGLGREDKLLLFVALRPGLDCDEPMRAKIVKTLRAEVSPRHVPDAIHHVAEIPRTLNGKKLEVPVKRILAGVPVEQAVALATVANPKSLDVFVELAPTLAQKGQS